MRIVRSPLARSVVGIAISIVALVLATRGVDLQRTAEVIGAASPAWIAVLFALVTADVAARGLRWQALVRPIKPVPFGHMFGYLLIGYLANNVLPARLGEFVRSWYLGEREEIGAVRALGTVVVERVIDVVVVVLIGSLAVLVLSARGAIASVALVGVPFAIALVVVLALLILADRVPILHRVVAWLERWPAVHVALGRLRDGLAVAGRPATVARAVGFSLVAWSFSVLAVAAAGQSIGVELSIGQAALISASVALAIAVPSGPAYLGTWELAAVAAASTFGLPADEAFALALIAHAAVVIVTSFGGVLALMRFGWPRRSPDAGVAQDALVQTAPGR
ncbi:MAG TPA: lysylphosphatidylglycerol synthase transmembrane domain-containing protein [Candidatus Limnocylindrales bacterium]|nr:lysylphosphatidylglycerol synthase transmembrane domain-containing protein [Candidatus Limnocylindrales bacterium]